MDKVAQKANSSRSLRGGTFETQIESILSSMLDKKKTKSFERSPKIFNREFNPDFVVEKKNGQIVSIDSTTTARTDRLRGKQWDAHGTKLFYLENEKKEIIAVVVVQDDKITQKEADNFRRCKARVMLPHSALDGVVSVDELISLLEEK